MRLGDLTFLDLYLHPQVALLKNLTSSSQLVDVAPPALKAQLDEIRGRCQATYSETQVPEFSIVEDNRLYRVTAQEDHAGAVLFVLRQFQRALKPFRDLGLPRHVGLNLLSSNLKGLVLFAGEPGVGKSTSLFSTVVQRLHMNGGVAVTVEDPIEQQLSGAHGGGYMFQFPASRLTGGYREPLLRALRMQADMVVVGEIRDSAAASEVVRASASGQLTFGTIHAGSASQALEKLAILAASGEGGTSSESMRYMLSLGVSMVIWQTMLILPNGGRQLSVRALSCIGEDGLAIRSKIRDNKLQTLENDIEHQSRRGATNQVLKTA
ncbi:ATPase, T2SS/T4P/T4SS family [Cupriavidus necator]|uniref:ATPase, T2SS/T4P/T4SS family n=1 Tax=Cupriavidus necator TaxID=106590 RepID=UPI00339D76F7